jgi:hypothetical protein
MNKKYIAILIMVLAVIIAGGFLYYYRNSIPAENILNTLKPTQKTALTLTDKKISDNTKPFKIDIVYPEISGLDSFNKTVSDAVNKEINDFKTNSLENDSAVKQVDPESYAKYPREYDLNISYDKGEIDENVVSIILEVYAFTGGAHGSTNFYSFNYNPKTKTEIKLADLFSGQPNYLQKISDFCIQDLTKQITDNFGDMQGTWIQDGAGPKEENYSIFLINKDNLVFYFPQYQVAPGAFGGFKVTMPKQ